MPSKARPWNRPEVKVYRPDAVPTITLDPEGRKAVDSATGEYIVLEPDVRGELGRFEYGDRRRGFIAEGGYRSIWFPDDRASAIKIEILRSERGHPLKYLSQFEFDVAPIARMMRGFSDVSYALQPRPIAARDEPPHQIIVIDSRPKFPTKT